MTLHDPAARRMAVRLPADEHRPARLEYRRLVRLGVTPPVALALADYAGRARRAAVARRRAARRRDHLVAS